MLLGVIFSSAAARSRGLPNPKSLLGVRALTHLEAAQLELALRKDAQDYIYNSALSIGEGLSGVSFRRFSWAAVKSYYAVFYSLRAYLASKGIALFYIGTTPCSVRATAGGHANKERGNTHQVVLEIFRRSFPRSLLLSQSIGISDPLDWVMARREEANYSIARFCDPECPAHFIGAEGRSMRRLLKDYLCDDRHIYTFDADHAMLAYPLRCLSESVSVFNAQLKNSDSQSQHIAKIFSDRQGPLADIITTLKLS